MRVLSVVHEDTDTGGGGLFERVTLERGEGLARWFTADGAQVPGDPTEWDAIMVFGGAMHPDQDAEHAWLADETGYIEAALAAEVPVLGVCLGAQLVARAAGARVGPAEQAEVGWHEVELNDAGAADPVLGVMPRRFTAFQWHYYTYELPESAVELATSAAARQAYRIGEHAWGVQFHPEVDRRMLDHWFDAGRDELPKPAEELVAETGRHIGTWNEHGRALCGAFLDEAERIAQEV
jgi:GMP synthase-like glutamine amidotransferase